jgi:hypothetical protein
VYQFSIAGLYQFTTAADIAPHGLEDLFHLRVRHNPIRASAAMFSERVKSKRFTKCATMYGIAENQV